jgi:hypothetical protein
VEIYHSIIQRKLLDPDNFETIAELARALRPTEVSVGLDRLTFRV